MIYIGFDFGMIYGGQICPLPSPLSSIAVVQTKRYIFEVNVMLNYWHVSLNGVV